MSKKTGKRPDQDSARNIADGLGFTHEARDGSTNRLCLTLVSYPAVSGGAWGNPKAQVDQP